MNTSILLDEWDEAERIQEILLNMPYDQIRGHVEALNAVGLHVKIVNGMWDGYIEVTYTKNLVNHIFKPKDPTKEPGKTMSPILERGSR